jgi:hypothetical protein
MPCLPRRWRLDPVRVERGQSYWDRVGANNHEQAGLVRSELMDKNEVARELAGLGQEEARLMRKLAKVQAKRCNLLSSCINEAGLDDETLSAARASKDGGG